MMLWRLELACFKFDIIYRPENEREIARITDIIKLEHNLSLLHDQLCHPWIARMYNWIRFKNLPFSVEKVKRVVNLCSCCNEVKPRFCRNERESIKESSPFESLNLDFKSPLPSVYRNRYLLTIIDEFYKIYLCPICSDISSATAIAQFLELHPIYIVIEDHHLCLVVQKSF